MLSCKSEARGRDGEPRAARRAALPIATNMKPPPRRIRVGRAALATSWRTGDAGTQAGPWTMQVSLAVYFGRSVVMTHVVRMCRLIQLSVYGA